LRQGPLPRLVAAAAVALGGLTVVIDWLTPLNVHVPILYGLPVLAAIWLRDARLVWGLALALTAADLAALAWGKPVAEPYSVSVVVANRLLAAGSLIAVAGVSHAFVHSLRDLEGQRSALRKQNEELETVNQELMQREEEIVRQNEEIQSQAEELERQSEELRLTNEELASREKMLEQLLELSRSLTAELGREEMLKRICEALGFLVSGHASAILERQGAQMALVCHNGFGPDGPERDAIPYAHSFSSLVMTRGQTGYVEDLGLRPDIHIPQPARGERFQSVIGTPLRVHGRCIGTIEIYEHHKQPWSEAQVTMIESLASQASVTLSSTELVEAIQQEKQRFEAVFRTVPFGMLVADDSSGDVVRVNPAAAALLNVAPGENLAMATPAGARLARSVYRDDVPLPARELPLSRALRGEETAAEELEVVFPTGRRLAVLASAAPIHDAKGRIVSAVCAFADISDLKALQRELELRRREAEEASVRKTRFLAAVSHDIRTPVNAINLLAELIRRVALNPALAGQIPELAQKLQANTLSLVELVSDILDVARFDSGKVELQESDFSLGDLIAMEVRQLLPLAADKGLALVVEPLERPIWLHTDRIKLGRVLGNIMGNAIKFTDHGEVRVSAQVTAEPDRRLLIRVTDTGPGIAPEHQSRIFDEFAQLRNPERDRGKGTGLGLAISKRLMDVIGGTIDVESQVGRGSVFTISLPASAVLLRVEATRSASETPVRPADAAAPPADRLLGLRILLVEDHPPTREGTASLLLGEGASVIEAPDGESALRLLEECQVDVLLLDMMLPDLDGREILKALQNRRPPALKSILVLTGDLTAERLAEIRRFGADALIEKPIDIDKLVTILRTLPRPAAEPGPPTA
jgi:signal transduction histidine kinase/ActR/RegA family two-component response regulator